MGISRRGSSSRSAVHLAAARRMGVQNSVFELPGSESDFRGKQSVAVGGEQRGSDPAGRRYASLARSGGPDDRVVLSAWRWTGEGLWKLERYGALGGRVSKREAREFSGNQAKGGGADCFGDEHDEEDGGAGKICAGRHPLRGDRTGNRRVAATCGPRYFFASLWRL